MTDEEATDQARALCHEIEAHVGRMDPRSEWAAARHTAGIALVAAALRGVHAAAFRAGQERMRERAVAAIRPETRLGSGPAAQGHAAGIREAEAAVRALPLEEE